MHLCYGVWWWQQKTRCMEPQTKTLPHKRRRVEDGSEKEIRNRRLITSSQQHTSHHTKSQHTKSQQYTSQHTFQERHRTNRPRQR